MEEVLSSNRLEEHHITMVALKLLNSPSFSTIRCLEVYHVFQQQHVFGSLFSLLWWCSDFVRGDLSNDLVQKFILRHTLFDPLSHPQAQEGDQWNCKLRRCRNIKNQ